MDQPLEGYSVEEVWIKAEPMDDESKIIATSIKEEESPKLLTIKSEAPFDDYEIVIPESNPLKLTTYQCDVCEKVFSRKESYTNHHKWHTGTSPHKCLECGKTFTRGIILKKHMKSHSKEEGISSSDRIMPKFPCEYCPKIYTRKQYLKSHISMHTQDSKHKCLHCNKMFTRNEYLLIHTRKHTGETPFKCEQCKRRFISMKSLKAHLDERGLCKKPIELSCYICSKSFTKQSSITNHMSRSHSTDGSFKCKECGKCFVVVQNLLFHMKTHKQ